MSKVDMEGLYLLFLCEETVNIYCVLVSLLVRVRLFSFFSLKKLERGL